MTLLSSVFSNVAAATFLIWVVGALLVPLLGFGDSDLSSYLIYLLSFASGNRDDAVFEDPFRLDVRRPNASSHLAFGFGRHFCLGAHLARLEVRAIFKELLGRLDHIELAGEPTWIKADFVQGPKSIPISYRMR